MAWLLDVNSLIALVDPSHVHHLAMHGWFEKRQPDVFGTCPLAENGLMRVLSQPRYPGVSRSPSEVIAILDGIRTNYRGVFQMLPDHLSISDSTVFMAEYLVRSKQITDAYLLGLALRMGGGW